ncbi:MAG TPA: pyrroloquinoline quinone-dependent dehydrogenase [Bryobacteraceae bacterium]|nr:pyrroloquinoline quinone-dependent dehydrogenase [Bryobacteraceae bacterium]
MSSTLFQCLLGLLLAGAAYGEWPYWAGDQGATRHSALSEINRSNVMRLKPAWTYHSGDKDDRGRTTIECTPIVVGGVMYVTSPMLKLIALDAATGKDLWHFDPFEGADVKAVNRGVAYWEDAKKRDQRILYAAGKSLYCINAKTGKVIPDFGKNGSVDLTAEMDAQALGDLGAPSSPGVIYKDLIVLGSRNGEGPRQASPGHIRAYNVLTGKREWIFHTIPSPGEMGHETWEGDSWKTAGSANVWGGFSVDEKRGLVFAGTGSATFDFYGGQRIGKNLFANSVIAIDANTGKRRWHYQIVHHDLWDYDLPTAPILARVKGKDAVVQVTKQGFTFVFDRDSGAPLFPIEERPVPASDIPGEKSWPTQPFPVKPPPFSPQRYEPTDISPEARAYVTKYVADMRAGGLYTPPSRQGTVVTPGTLGGGLWGGGSFDPKSGRLFVSSQNLPSIMKIVDAPKGSAFPYSHAGYTKLRDADGYPGIKPPWGQLTAIDLNEGTIAWQVPLGEHPELTAKGVPKTGTENYGGAISTDGGLIFIAATKDKKFRAIDSASGKTLWETELEYGGFATPATYSVNGKQYVVIGAGGGGKMGAESGDAFVAFKLP